ncbi:MAG: acyl carrier protein [Oscillospiraceae bacterium]|nr:acyl carrier protein [Oscillospiraceae bacterium]
MVFEKIKAIIVDQLDISEEKVKLTSSIQDDLGADSLDIVDLVMSFEDEFGLEIPDDKVENVKTVEDIVKFIESKVESE